MIPLSAIAEVAPTTARPALPPDTLLPVIALNSIDERGTVRPLDREPLERAAARGLRAVHPGDVVHAGISPGLENRKVAIVPALPEGVAMASRELIVLRPTAVEPEWLHAYLRRRAVAVVLRRQATGSTGRRRVAPGTFGRLLLAEYPAAGRRDVLTVLHRIDRIAADRERLSARLVTAVGLLAPPETFDRRLLGDLLAPLDGLASAPADGSPADASSIVLQERHVTAGVVDERARLDVRRRARSVDLRKGDLVVTTQVRNPARLGAAAIYEGVPAEARAGSSLTRLRLRDPAHARFLWVWLNSQDARGQMLAVSVRTGSSTVVSRRALVELIVPWPNAPQLAGIAQRASDAGLAITLSRTQHDRLDQLRERWLDDAFGPVALAPPEARPVPVPVQVAPHDWDTQLVRRLSGEQRRTWKSVSRSAEPVSLDQIASAAERERARRTLTLLEAAGMVVKDLSREVESWRLPDRDSELLEQA